jgi:hypothetical protein
VGPLTVGVKRVTPNELNTQEKKQKVRAPVTGPHLPAAVFALGGVRRRPPRKSTRERRGVPITKTEKNLNLDSGQQVDDKCEARPVLTNARPGGGRSVG